MSGRLLFFTVCLLLLIIHMLHELLSFVNFVWHISIYNMSRLLLLLSRYSVCIEHIRPDPRCPAGYVPTQCISGRTPLKSDRPLFAYVLSFCLYCWDYMFLYGLFNWYA